MTRGDWLSVPLTRPPLPEGASVMFECQRFRLYGRREIESDALDPLRAVEEAKAELRALLAVWLSAIAPPEPQWRTPPEIEMMRDFERDVLIVQLYARGYWIQPTSGYEWLVELPQ